MANGNTVEVNASPSVTVGVLKNQIYDKTGVPTEYQHVWIEKHTYIPFFTYTREPL